jgi:hypothetical protein
MLDLIIFVLGNTFIAISLIVLLVYALVSKDENVESDSDKLRSFMNEYKSHFDEKK